MIQRHTTYYNPLVNSYKGPDYEQFATFYIKLDEKGTLTKKRIVQRPGTPLDFAPSIYFCPSPTELILLSITNRWDLKGDITITGYVNRFVKINLE